MRSLLPLLLLAMAGTLLAGLAPTAQAQAASQYNIVLSLVPPETPLTAQAPHTIIFGRIDFVGDPSTMLNWNGVAVEYVVTMAPSWLAVVVSPSSDVIPLTMGGTTVTGSRTFAVSLHASNATLDESVLDTVEITATVSPTSPFLSYPKSVSQAVPVQYFAPPHDDDCEEHATAKALLAEARASQEAAAPEETGDEPLIVQSGGVTPLPTWSAVAGFGLVGAGLGLLLSRRRKA